MKNKLLKIWYDILAAFNIVQYDTAIEYFKMPFKPTDTDSLVLRAIKNFDGVSIVTDEGLWGGNKPELLVTYGTPIEYYKWLRGKKKNKKVWSAVIGERRVLSYNLHLRFACMRISFTDKFVRRINKEYGVNDYFPYCRRTISRVARSQDSSVLEYADFKNKEQITYRIYWNRLTLGLDLGLSAVTGEPEEVTEWLNGLYRRFKEQETAYALGKKPTMYAVYNADEIMQSAISHTFLTRLQSTSLFRPEDGVEMSDVLKDM